MPPVDPNAIPTQTFDWGAVKWLVTPDLTPGASVTLGEVVLQPGRSQERHNHPDAEEVVHVLAGDGRQLLEDEAGNAEWFDLRPGATVHVRPGQFHATESTGWQALRLLVLYSPGGSERALRELPDFREVPPGRPPLWGRA